MTCQQCTTKFIFNMGCISCVARHVLYVYKPKSERLAYMKSLASRYNLDLELLKAEVTKQFKEKKNV